MSRMLPVRRSAHATRRRPVRRASRRISLIQLAAAAVMILAAGAIWGLRATPSFAVDTVELRGNRFTDEAQVRAAARLNAGPNAFALRTDDVARQLARLPAVLEAGATVELPRTLVVNVVERVPRLIWQIGQQRFAVDESGLLFGLVDGAGNPIPSGPLPARTPAPSASPSPTSPPPSAAASDSPAPSPSATGRVVAGATAAPTPTAPPPSLAPPVPFPSATPGPNVLPPLAVIVDRTAEDAGLGLGDTLDPIRLDAAFRIGQIVPAKIDSTAQGLAIVVDDEHGFTVSSIPSGWVAEFGFYTATIRKPDVVPQQVEALQALFARVGEAHVAWTWLTGDVAADHVNTYIPR